MTTTLNCMLVTVPNSQKEKNISVSVDTGRRLLLRRCFDDLMVLLCRKVWYTAERDFEAGSGPWFLFGWESRGWGGVRCEVQD